MKLVGRHSEIHAMQSLLNDKKAHNEVAFISSFGIVDNEYKTDYVDHDYSMDILFEA